MTRKFSALAAATLVSTILSGCATQSTAIDFLIAPADTPEGLQLVPFPGSNNSSATEFWEYREAKSNPSEDTPVYSSEGVLEKWTQYFWLEENNRRAITVTAYSFETPTQAISWLVSELDERDMDDCDGMHFVQIHGFVITTEGRGTFRNFWVEGSEEYQNLETELERWDAYNDAAAESILQHPDAISWC